MNQTETSPAISSADLRDIASYLGAPCSYERPHDYAEEWIQKKAVVGFKVLEKLERDPVRNFKLHLKSLKDLTDEDLIGLLQVVIETNSLSEPPTVPTQYWAIERLPGADVAAWGNGDIITIEGLYILTSTGAVSEGDNAIPMASTIRYWQQKHYYVPGLIAEKFVQLEAV